MLRAGFGTGRSIRQCLLLPGLALLLSAHAFAQTAQSARDADRGGQYFVNSAAAAAATEKVLAQMTTDFVANGKGYVDTNLAYYSTLVPSASDNAYWTNFTFLNAPMGATNSTYIAPPYQNSFSITTLQASEFAGMNAIESVYSIFSYAQQTNNANTNLTGGMRQDVALTSIPLFEFAIFYNSLLEFTTAGTLVINGYVHANSNIYVGSGNPLTFNSTVTTTGSVTNPAWAGDSQSQYAGKVTFNGTPAPGVFAGQPAINLPMGSNKNDQTNLIQILYPATGTDSFVMKQQRYYNKAQMLILVSNVTYNVTNTATQVTIKLQAPPTNGMSIDDISPMWFTNIRVSATNVVTDAVWTANNFDSWLLTTNIFKDARQAQWMKTSQINVSNFTIWCRTNNCIYNSTWGTNKFSSSVPLNIVYVGDWRTNNSTTNIVVRLMGGGSTNFPPYGLTVATPNPLYVWGNYDTPSTNNLNSTNVIGTYPTSFISDALTILSQNWNDANSSGPLSSRIATSTTVNGAMITGIVYSTGSGGTGTTQYSGGVHNMPRLLEDWSGTGVSLTLNTSMVNLYPSQIATAPFIWPGSSGIVYGVPNTRQFYFNQNYTTAVGLPPGTPLLPLAQPQHRFQTMSNPRNQQ